MVDDLAGSGPARTVARCVLWTRSGRDMKLIDPNKVDLGAYSRDGLMMYMIERGE